MKPQFILADKHAACYREILQYFETSLPKEDSSYDVLRSKHEKHDKNELTFPFYEHFLKTEALLYIFL